MKYLFTSPAPALQPFILRYYQVRGFTSESEPYKEFTLPNGLASLVFHFEEKIKVSNVEYNGEDIPQFYIFGQYTKPVFVRHTFGKADVFGVVFQPAAFHYFLGVPQQELTDKLIDVRDGLGREANEVLERMYTRPTFEARKAIADAFFLKRLRNTEYFENVVNRAVSEILSRHGNVQVKDLTEQFNVSRQHLNRMFLPKVGLNVKEFARTVRFNCALRALSTSKYSELKQVVEDFGFYDESHLVKEFDHFTGGRPSDFLRKENELAKFLMGV
ncbi:MAG: AraC family transcriptional regulator [Lewinellaceae bacterium]|nr:AraC family transcriptional regulator [Lewinellaceae bacterium]